MLWHVYQRSLKSSKLDKVYIATDDELIRQACDGLGLNVLMTRKDHSTGTDRVAECLSQVQADYYVNIQGDEPMTNPDSIDAVVGALVDCRDERIVASNAYTPIGEPSDAINTDVVKVVLAVDETALAYSRLTIPYPKGDQPTYLRQLGLYGFRKEGLRLFADHVPGPAERAEEVEMLRFLEYGYKVLMVKVLDQGISVDTSADLARVRDLMADDNP